MERRNLETSRRFQTGGDQGWDRIGASTMYKYPINHCVLGDPRTSTILQREGMIIHTLYAHKIKIKYTCSHTKSKQKTEI